jgi:subtilisin family serine protease
MQPTFEIKLGEDRVALQRSDVLVALRPQPGRSTSFDTELQSLQIRGLGARRGKVGWDDIVELPTAAKTQASARLDLKRMISLQRQAAVYHTSNDAVPFVPKGTIYLSFVPGAAKDAIEGLMKQHQLFALRSERGGFMTVTMPGDPVESCAALQADPLVAVAEPDLVTPREPASELLPKDRLFGRHWHLNNTGMHEGTTFGYRVGADARVVEAWYALGSLGSEAVIIGLVDDGFDLSHPDLSGKAVFPWDFSRNTPDVTPGDPTVSVTDWHGTACAGVAAGRALGGEIVGAAPNARIMPVRMGPDIDTETLARVFEYMADKGAWVVNCSWGPRAERFPMPQRLSNAITWCAREGRGGLGTAIVFAAGNLNRSINDARYHNGLAVHPDVITVSSSTSLDERSDTSNFGSEICICAPSSGGGGWTIVTSDVTGTWTDMAGAVRPRGYGIGDYHMYFGGTSSSSALVSGVCALVLTAAPRLPAVELRAILERTARRIGSPSNYGMNGHSPHFGFGCVDAAAAVAAARASLVG